MAHAGNTKIWAKIISAYEEHNQVFVAEGRRKGEKGKYICPLGA